MPLLLPAPNWCSVTTTASPAATNSWASDTHSIGQGTRASAPDGGSADIRLASVGHRLEDVVGGEQLPGRTEVALSQFRVRSSQSLDVLPRHRLRSIPPLSPRMPGLRVSSWSAPDSLGIGARPPVEGIAGRCGSHPRRARGARRFRRGTQVQCPMTLLDASCNFASPPRNAGTPHHHTESAVPSGLNRTPGQVSSFGGPDQSDRPWRAPGDSSPPRSRSRCRAFDRRRRVSQSRRRRTTRRAHARR